MVEKIAIISDLHCHPSNQKPTDSFLFSDMPAFPIAKNPVTALSEMIKKEDLHVGTLIVLGDITNKINRQGFITGWTHANDIARMLGATHVIAAIGNHDVDSRHKESKTNSFELCRTLSPTYPFGADYCMDSFWANGFQVYNTENISICIVNSTFSHTNEKEAKHGAITEAQLELLECALRDAEPKPFRLAISHHHPIQHEECGLGSEDLMTMGSVLVDLLSKYNYKIFLHGHKHFPRIKYAAGDSSTPVVFAAGSFSAISPAMLTNSRNLFHILEINNDPPIFELSIKGKFYSWEWGLNRGWVRTSMISGGIPYQCGFGCRIPLPEIGIRIRDFLLASPGHFIKDWGLIQSAIPEVEYLLPNQLSDLCELLIHNHNVTIEPKLPDLPNIIGIIGA